jgi:hypothetical protein
MSLHHEAGRLDWRVGLAEGADDTVAAPFGGAEVDEEHLIGGVIEDVAQLVPHFGEVGRRQLALENRELQMVAVIAASLEDLPQALVIRDVVTNQVSIPHGRRSSREGIFDGRLGILAEGVPF